MAKWWIRLMVAAGCVVVPGTASAQVPCVYGGGRLAHPDVAPGALIRVRPIGVMTMRDRGEVDDKILAVPVSSVDPTYDTVRSAADLPPLDLRRIEEFFRVYKRLPDATVEVTIGEWRPASAALALLAAALKSPQPAGR